MKISEIGYGAWGIGKQLWKGAEDESSLAALHQAVDLGVNFIDTALVYGNGHSEKLIGQVLRDRPERVYVASKIPPKNYRWPAQGTLEEAFPKEHMIASVERSLQNLQVDRLDLIQLHVWNPSWLENGEWFDTLSWLKDEGKIGAFGISVNDHDPGSALEAVRRGKVDTVQVIYNIFDQSPEDELLPLCLREDIGVIARVPFDEGGLTGQVTPETRFPKKDWRNLYFSGDRRGEVFRRVESLKSFLGNEARTLPELALKFCLHHPAVSSVIPGMRTADHVRRNTSVSDGPPLSERTIERLRKHRWDRNFYP